MALKIGELLIHHRLITREQLQKGLETQKSFGGKLGTNLVELGFVTDTALAQFLSHQLKMPAAKYDDFVNIPKTILALVPKEFAMDYKVIPLRMEKKLIVAISDVNDLVKIDELGFKIGKGLTPVVAPEIWIISALERYYGIPREARYIAIEDDQISAKISEIDSALNLGSTVSENTTLSLQTFVDQLLKTKTKEDVFSALFDFLSTFSPQMAIFVLKKGMVTGAMLRGFPIHVSQFQKVEIPLTSDTVFRKVIDGQTSYFGPLNSRNDEGILTQALGLPNGKKVLLRPVSFRGKGAALMLMIADAEDSTEIQSRDHLFSLVFAKAGYALELGALRKMISELPPS